jgi:hypothetical protein
MKLGDCKEDFQRYGVAFQLFRDEDEEFLWTNPQETKNQKRGENKYEG